MTSGGPLVRAAVSVPTPRRPSPVSTVPPQEGAEVQAQLSPWGLSPPEGLTTFCPSHPASVKGKALVEVEKPGTNQGSRREAWVPEGVQQDGGRGAGGRQLHGNAGPWSPEGLPSCPREVLTRKVMCLRLVFQRNSRSH